MEDLIAFFVLLLLLIPFILWDTLRNISPHFCKICGKLVWYKDRADDSFIPVTYLDIHQKCCDRQDIEIMEQIDRKEHVERNGKL